MNRETKVRVEVKLVTRGIIVVLTTVESRQARCVMGSATRRPTKQAIMHISMTQCYLLSLSEILGFLFFKFSNTWKVCFVFNTGYRTFMNEKELFEVYH